MSDQYRRKLQDDLQLSAANGAAWLVQRIGADGTPAGSDKRNSWWRVPWALAFAGHPLVAAKVLHWVKTTAMDDEGDLRPGAFRKDVRLSPIYELTHLAIGAQLVGRYDIAQLLMRKLAHYQHPGFGGGYHYRDRSNQEQEWLLTTQIGLASLITGHLDTAHEVYRWIRDLWSAQPALDQNLLYVTTRGASPVTEFDESEAWVRVVDFKKPQQAFYHPGAAAAFLADYSLATGDREPVNLARSLMQLNINGCPEQFEDRQSVQICKFGWGAARLLVADPDGEWLPHVIRMAEWFLDRQEGDGSWLPSTFKMSNQPSDLDKMWKTAEHLMEVVQIQVALGQHIYTL